jgi:hypothetical protein
VYPLISGSDKLARGYWRMITADASLCVVFELVDGNSDTFPVRVADAIIAADKGRERNGLRRGKARIPAGSVLHRLASLAVSILILVRRSLPHKLLSGLWILALAEFREVLGRDRSDKAELPSYS